MLTKTWKWSVSVLPVILVVATVVPAALAQKADTKSVEAAITKMEMDSRKADLAGQNASWMKAHNTDDYQGKRLWQKYGNREVQGILRLDDQGPASHPHDPDHGHLGKREGYVEASGVAQFAGGPEDR